jgi:hypothetical protein
MVYRCTARAAGMILSRDSAMVQLSGLLCLVPLVLDSAALQARVAERCLPIILLALQQHMEEEEVVSKSLILLGVLGQVRRQLRPALGRLAAAACAACPVCGGRMVRALQMPHSPCLAAHRWLCIAAVPARPAARVSATIGSTRYPLHTSSCTACRETERHTSCCAKP